MKYSRTLGIPGRNKKNKPQPVTSEETGLLDSIMSPAAFLESYPVQANLYLRHGANDNPYEASSNMNISFNLRLIAELYRIYKSDDKLSDSYFSKYNEKVTLSQSLLFTQEIHK